MTTSMKKDYMNHVTQISVTLSDLKKLSGLFWIPTYLGMESSPIDVLNTYKNMS